MSLRMDPFKSTSITLFHMFDIQFPQVIFPMCIHHFIEYGVDFFIIALPPSLQEMANFIWRDNYTDKPNIIL